MNDLGEFDPPMFWACMDKPGQMVNSYSKDLTSIGLYNPPESGVILAIHHLNGVMMSVGSGNQTDFLTTQPLSIIPDNIIYLPIRSSKLTLPPTSKAIAISQATLPAESYPIMVVDHFAGGSAMMESSSVKTHMLHGAVELMPNSIVTIQGTGPQHLAWWSIFWKEVPIVQDQIYRNL